MAMVKFWRGASVPTTRDNDTLYFDKSGKIYLGETLIADVTVLDTETVNNLVAQALNQYYTKTEIDGFIAAISNNFNGYRTSAAQDVIDNEIKASVKAISDDYLKAADKTELEGKITAHETAVNTKFNDYNTKEAQKAIDDAQDAEIAKKANSEDVYAKTEADSLLAAKADKTVVDTLVGEDANKSARTIAADEASKAIATVIGDAPEAFDTLKEIADWIQGGDSSNTDAADMLADIQALKTEVYGEDGDASNSRLDQIDSKFGLIGEKTVSAYVQNELAGLSTDIKTNDNFVVANANKLNGQEASYYATAQSVTDLQTKLTTDGPDSIIVATANEAAHAQSATSDANGQSIVDTYATKAEAAAADELVVHKAGDETITGTKHWLTKTLEEDEVEGNPNLASKVTSIGAGTIFAGNAGGMQGTDISEEGIKIFNGTGIGLSLLGDKITYNDLNNGPRDFTFKTESGVLETEVGAQAKADAVKTAVQGATEATVADCVKAINTMNNQVANNSAETVALTIDVKNIVDMLTWIEG